MVNTDLMFSNKSDIWATPKELYNQYMLMGAFDPCPINPQFDGLKINWRPLCYVNPPYSELRKWLEKALYEIEEGNTHLAIFLVHARTDTRWFQDLILGKHAYKFLRGRLKFGEQPNSAPFPSMIIYLT